ncbi:efflux transporter outer membrane subunit [Sphingobium sp.]|uniref:efflux transporter outer membrane subunit n=1 Tax=Sphingobium sp. TaxID=1912891 RepID=UPI0028BD31DD|nr:efflux transporter outer membrane subunit [Sphingobium sp.]
MPRKHIVPTTAMAAVLLALGGCAAVPDLGPAPQMAPPSSFAADRSLSSDAPGAWPGFDWWKDYGDPQLNTLIDEALAGSPNLSAAIARVGKAAAYAEQANAAHLPTLDATASAPVSKQSYNEGIPPAFVPQGWNDTGSLKASLGFDLDLWGKNKAAYAAARSDVEAAQLDCEQTILTLSTNIADAYADLAKLFAARAVQERALDVREQTTRLTADRVATGLDTQAELKQAQSAVPSARADLAATDEQIALTRNRLAALLGKGPDRGLEIGPPTVSLATRGIPADATTDLIGRRPDIVAARVRVEAAASRIKVARVSFYPSVNLSAAFGVQSLGLDNLFKSGSTVGNAGPAISLPLFHGGELRGQYRSARASYTEAVANYDRTVTDAYQAVADAVASRRALDIRLAQSSQSLRDSQAAWSIARQRYEGGLSRYLDVLSAQESVLQAERAVADLKARAFTLDVALVRALGGGFSAPTAASANTPSKEETHG